MNKYIVTSKTTREKEGHPELCWMDIAVSKLQDAAAERVTYIFLCFVGETLYEYTIPSDMLLQVFTEKNVNINVRGERYTFFFEYATGTLYRTMTRKVRNEVCRLTSAGVLKGSPADLLRIFEHKKKHGC